MKILECQNANKIQYHKKYYQKNKDKIKNRHRLYCKLNKDKIKLYYKKNKDKFKERYIISKKSIICATCNKLLINKSYIKHCKTKLHINNSIKRNN